MLYACNLHSDQLPRAARLFVPQTAALRSSNCSLEEAIEPENNSEQRLNEFPTPSAHTCTAGLKEGRTGANATGHSSSAPDAAKTHWPHRFPHVARKSLTFSFDRRCRCAPEQSSGETQASASRSTPVGAFENAKTALL